MSDAAPLAVFTTLHTADEARRLARSAVEARLAACVHIEEIRSVFRWRGGIEEEPEFRLLFKVSSEGYEALAAFVLRHHPYDEPALWAVPMAKGSESFFDWIAAASTGAPPPPDPGV